MTSVAVFIFHRDLRLYDNTGLLKLVEAVDTKIIPCFVFNSKQIDKKRNAYYNAHAVKFMLECLQNLQCEQLNGALQCFYGDEIKAVEEISKQYKVTHVGWNADFTPFAISRDNQLEQYCKSHKIECIIGKPEYTLFDLDAIRTQTGTSYEVFTPFYRKCMSSLHMVSPIHTATEAVIKRRFLHKANVSNTVDMLSYMPKGNVNNDIIGGRDKALEILQYIRNKQFEHYDNDRDFPFKAKTTRLSAYLKFGCISVREAFWTCMETHGRTHGLVRELVWREFYAHVARHHAHVLLGQSDVKSENQSMKPKYKYLEWKKDDTDENIKLYKAWCEGQTGFPLVDAAMRCMNATGFMHNRLRMLVASFLTKDMHLDWRLGEKYFAQTLVDYDPASNSGGWQWAAGVGADAQPYYRIFNPWTQSTKYDKNCEFIKQWIPELTSVNAKDIHKWHQRFASHENIKYPHPILDHTEECKKTLLWYKRVA